jgi:hypothetical protein
VVKKVHIYKTHHMMRKTREGGVTREKVKPFLPYFRLFLT